MEIVRLFPADRAIHDLEHVRVPRSCPKELGQAVALERTSLAVLNDLAEPKTC